MSHMHRAMSSLAWVLFEGAGRQVFSAVTLVVLLWLLDSEDFGLFALAAVCVRAAQVIQLGGLTSGLIQRRVLDPEHLDAAFLGVLALSAGTSMVLWFSADLIASFFGEPTLTGLVHWMAIVPFLSGFNQVHLQLLNRDMRFKDLAKRNLVANPIGGIAAIAAGLSGLGVWSLVIREICTELVLLVICWSSSRWRPACRWSKRHARELFAFGYSMTGANILNFTRKEAATIIIGKALGVNELGYYNIATRICGVLKATSVTGVGAVFYPLLSRLQDDTPAVQKAFLTALRVSCGATFPLYVGVAMLAPIAVPVILGPEWLPATMVLQILAIQALVESFSALSFTMLASAGLSKLKMKAVAVSVAAGLVMALIVVRYGVEAVAGAYLLESLLLGGMGLWFLSHSLGLHVSQVWNVARGPLVATVVMVVVMAVLMQPQALHQGAGALVKLVAVGELALWASLAAVVYAGALMLLDRQFYRIIKRAMSTYRR